MGFDTSVGRVITKSAHPAQRHAVQTGASVSTVRLAAGADSEKLSETAGDPVVHRGRNVGPTGPVLEPPPVTVDVDFDEHGLALDNEQVERGDL